MTKLFWARFRHFFHRSKSYSFQVKRNSCWVKSAPYEDGCSAVLQILARKKSKCHFCPIQDLKYVIYYSTGKTETRYLSATDFVEAVEMDYWKPLPRYKFNVLVAAWFNGYSE